MAKFKGKEWVLVANFNPDLRSGAYIKIGSFHESYRNTYVWLDLAGNIFEEVEIMNVNNEVEARDWFQLITYTVV